MILKLFQQGGIFCSSLNYFCSILIFHVVLLFKWYADEIHFGLDQHAELDLYSAISLKQQSADRHVAPLVHIILIPSQPVFAKNTP
jgi:hypothetical protein